MDKKTPSELGGKDGEGTANGTRLLSLRTRFFLGISVILLLFCSLCAYFVYRQGLLLVEEAAYAKSQIVMSAVEANQAYVREVLRPKVFEKLGSDAFMLEAMSTSFVSRAVMERFNTKMPEYNYRRVSIGARNPAFEANPAEVGMIRYFNANPDKRDWSGIVQSGGESHYMRFRPVYFENSCLRCHGSVEDAPKEMLEKYGRERGFGRREGEIAGIVAIGIPVDVALGRIKGKALSVFMPSLMIAGILFVIIGSFFNRLVASDLRGILKIFREELPPEKAPRKIPPARSEIGLGDAPESLQWADELKHFKSVHAKDEIDEIRAAARSMAKDLRDNRGELERNAKNLEKTVSELLQSKELLQSVFDGITDILVLLDADFRIRMVNRAHLKRYGLAEEDVIGRHCYDLHSGDLCPFPDCGMQKVLLSKKPVIEEVQSNGGEIFLIHFYPVLDDKGQVTSVVRYARDVTEQKRIEQNIQKTEKLASLGQLSAGIAHEINNPLGVILTYSDLLKKQFDDRPDAVEDIEVIEKHATTCKRIVSDLLRFARGQSTRTALAPLNRTLEEAIRVVDSAFCRKNIVLHREFDPDLPLLDLDSDKIQQVWVNLLMNSQQAIEQNGQISITTSYIEETGKVKVTIRDNGKGIEPELLPRIFDPFFTTKAAGEGTGLGLSVSYGIVNDHGGQILVESEPGQWTQFTVLFPVKGGALEK